MVIFDSYVNVKQRVDHLVWWVRILLHKFGDVSRQEFMGSWVHGFMGTLSVLVSASMILGNTRKSDIIIRHTPAEWLHLVTEEVFMTFFLIYPPVMTKHRYWNWPKKQWVFHWTWRFSIVRRRQKTGHYWIVFWSVKGMSWWWASSRQVIVWWSY